MRTVLVIVLIAATVGAVTIAPEIAPRHPAVWWVVIALAGAAFTAILATVIRSHRAVRAVRDVWSDR